MGFNIGWSPSAPPPASPTTTSNADPNQVTATAAALQAQAASAAPQAQQVLKQLNALQQQAQQVDPNSAQGKALAAQLQQLQPQLDSFEKLTSQMLGAELLANRYSPANNLPFPLAQAAAQAVQLMQQYAQPKDVGTFQQNLADLIASNPSLKASDIQQAAMSAIAQSAQDKAGAIYQQEVPDDAPVDLKPGDSDFVGKWIAAAQKTIGNGDKGKVEDYLNKNRGVMTRMAQVIGACLGAKPEPGSKPEDALYGSAIAAMSAGYPNGSFELVAVRRKDSFFFTQDNSQMKGGLPDVVVRMSLPGKDGQDKSYAFSLHPDALLSDGNAAKFQATLLANPAIAQAWNASLAKLRPELAKADPAASLKALQGSSGRILMAQAALRMEPAAITALFGKGDAAKPLDGLLQKVDLKPDDALIRVEGSTVASGALQGGIKTVVSTTGSDEGLKNYKYFKAHLQDLAAPMFLQALQTAPATLSSSGNALENYVGQTMGYQPTTTSVGARGTMFTGDALTGIKPVTAQIRAVMKDAGVQQAKITPLPIVFNPMSGSGGAQQMTLFRIDTPKGAKFVDGQDGRLYQNLDDYAKNNQLPSGDISFLKSGELKLGPNGKLDIETHSTPSNLDTPWKKVAGQGGLLDTVGPYVGMGMMAFGFGQWAMGLRLTGKRLLGKEIGDEVLTVGDRAFSAPGVKGRALRLFPKVFGPGDSLVDGVRPSAKVLKIQQPLLQYGGMGSMVWFNYRSARDLYDRGTHGQSWSPFVNPLDVNNSQQLSDWLMLGTNGLGMAASYLRMPRIQQEFIVNKARELGVKPEDIENQLKTYADTHPERFNRNTGLMEKATPPEYAAELQGAINSDGTYRALTLGSGTAGVAMMASFWQSMLSQWNQMTPDDQRSQLLQNLFWTVTMPPQFEQMLALRNSAIRHQQALAGRIPEAEQKINERLAKAGLPLVELSTLGGGNPLAGATAEGRVTGVPGDLEPHALAGALSRQPAANALPAEQQPA